jgi:hypothetical protein
MQVSVIGKSCREDNCSLFITKLDRSASWKTRCLCNGFLYLVDSGARIPDDSLFLDIWQHRDVDASARDMNTDGCATLQLIKPFNNVILIRVALMGSQQCLATLDAQGSSQLLQGLWGWHFTLDPLSIWILNRKKPSFTTHMLNSPSSFSKLQPTCC